MPSPASARASTSRAGRPAPASRIRRSASGRRTGHRDRAVATSPSWPSRPSRRRLRAGTAWPRKAACTPAAEHAWRGGASSVRSTRVVRIIPAAPDAERSLNRAMDPSGDQSVDEGAELVAALLEVVELVVARAGRGQQDDVAGFGVGGRSLDRSLQVAAVRERYDAFKRLA